MICVDGLDTHINFTFTYLVLVVICTKQFTYRLDAFLHTDDGYFFVNTFILYTGIAINHAAFAVVVE